MKKDYKRMTKKSLVVVTIVSIRPDLIRMSEVIRKMDKLPNTNHILIHTGQHYDRNLNDDFFEELHLRRPDFVLETGIHGSNHFEQLSYLSVSLPKLFQTENIHPDLIILLGDSNSVGVSMVLKKEHYTIAHIEAGMRSYDKRMLEEINRTVCDHCSDLLFVYHEDYARQLERENIRDNIFIVGNTIVEPMQKLLPHIMLESKRHDHILLDIHRPENVLYPDRLQGILAFADFCSRRYDLPLYILKYRPTLHAMRDMDMGRAQWVDLMPFGEYLSSVYHSLFLISDSGTAQEEPCLLQTKVIIPRDYTERPQSFANACSFQLLLSPCNRDACIGFIEDRSWTPNTEWLGRGDTSQLIVDVIHAFLAERTGTDPVSGHELVQYQRNCWCRTL